MASSSLFWLVASLISLLALLGGGALWFVVEGQSYSNEQQSPAVLSAAQRLQEIPNIDAIISFNDRDGNSKKIIQCADTKCKTVTKPKNIGEKYEYKEGDWYYYSATGELSHYDASGTDTRIISPADLVKPRGLLTSHAEDYIAFWLDNTTEDGEGFTELWVYNTGEKSTSVVAENLFAPDIVTDPTWNKSGTSVWFVADSGEGENEKLEFIVAMANPAKTHARFKNGDIENIKKAANTGTVDISRFGTTLAFAERVTRIADKLHIVRDGGLDEEHSLTGRATYVEWISEGTLIYAVQRGSNIEFWRWADGTHQHMGNERGVLLTAKAGNDGRYLGFINQAGIGIRKLHVMDMNSGLVHEQATIPRNTIRSVELLQVKVQESSFSNSPDVTHELTDSEMVAFVEKHTDNITSHNVTAIERILTTDRINTVFIEYESEQGSQRLLMTIRDAIHPEWTILALYEAVNGEWQRTQGTGTDPNPTRLYEWEKEIEQWILKQEYQPST